MCFVEWYQPHFARDGDWAGASPAGTGTVGCIESTGDDAGVRAAVKWLAVAAVRAPEVVPAAAGV